MGKMGLTQFAMAEYNPFAPAHQITDLDDVPDFSKARVVIDPTAEQSHRPEFPAYFDNGLQSSYHDETSLNGTRHSTSSTDTMRSEAGEGSSGLVVHQQPQREDNPATRKALPVYTLGWSSTPHSQFLPLTGLDFITGVSQVNLQQTVEDLIAPQSTSNRYIIKIPNGETLYVASENSSPLMRTFLGAQRGFSMVLLDPTRQEAAIFKRRPGCAMNMFGCIPQELEVYTTDPDLFIGKVRQDWTLTTMSFTIIDQNYNVIFRVKGPHVMCPCGMKPNLSFLITNKDSDSRLGTISRQWDNLLGDYSISVIFPAPSMPEGQKMLIIGAAMLIEYMYYAPGLLT